jgi:hypothetical protein
MCITYLLIGYKIRFAQPIPWKNWKNSAIALISKEMVFIRYCLQQRCTDTIVDAEQQ